MTGIFVARIERSSTNSFAFAEYWIPDAFFGTETVDVFTILENSVLKEYGPTWEVVTYLPHEDRALFGI